MPSLREMSGPWVRAILASEAWGCLPSWRRLPTKGHGWGPGGRFRFCLGVDLKRVKEKKRKVIKRGRRRRMMKDMSWSWNIIWN